MRKLVGTLVLSSCSCLSIAGPWGNDFGISYDSVAGGMGASTYANPYTATSAVFGNPATLLKFKETPRTVTFGAAYVNIDFRLNHDGIVTGAPFSGKSDTVNFLVPNASVITQLSDDLAIGGGFGITAGLGADFRNDTPLSPGINYIAFGNNFSIAKKLSDSWTIGATATMGFGLLELGPVQSSGTVNDIGFRGTLGALYDKGNFSFSAHYSSKLGFEFDNVFLISGNEFGDVPLEQPSEVVLGLSYRFAEHWDWQAALLFKNWGDADGYEDIWEDQEILTTGFQYSKDKWAYRFGFGVTSDLRREDLGSTFAGNTTLGFGGQAIPLNPTVIEFLQASLAPSFWDYHVSAGIGYSFSDVTRLDVFVAQIFGDEEVISANNQTDVDFLQLGGGFTWTF
jgi:long-chain fatty acid transport protein